jgi:hypothetical protein
MTTRKASFALAIIVTLILCGAAISIIVWWEQSERAVLGPLPAALLPPEAPTTIMISCEKGEEFGSTMYPILTMKMQR